MVPDVYSQESGLNLSPRLAGSIAGCRRPVRLKVRGEGRVVAGERKAEGQAQQRQKSTLAWCSDRGHFGGAASPPARSPRLIRSFSAISRSFGLKAPDPCSSRGEHAGVETVAGRSARCGVFTYQRASTASLRFGLYSCRKFGPRGEKGDGKGGHHEDQNAARSRADVRGTIAYTHRGH